MRRAMASVEGQRLIAALLLVSLLPVQAAALFSAQASSRADICPCCRHKDHRDCGMSRSAPIGEVSLDATPSCGNYCRHLAALVSSFPSHEPEAGRAALLEPGTAGFDVTRPPHHADEARFAWRYQRPPPLS
jgi:hypothetical protein